MVDRVLIHIGYHKTATTWMQQRLFVPEHGYRQIARHTEVWNHLVGVHGFDFDPSAMRDAMQVGMSDLLPGEVPVISSEIISGHPFFGGIGNDAYAERIKQVAPEALILISVRHQQRMLTSIYMQYLSRGGVVSPEKFFSGDPDLGFFGFRPAHLEYHRLVSLYHELFGRQNVLVVSQESVSKDLDAVARSIANFSGNRTFSSVLPTHRAVYAPSYPEYAVPLLRRVNKLQRSVLNPAPAVRLGNGTGGLYRLIGAGMRRPPFSMLKNQITPVSNCVRSMFAKRFDDSNRALMELVDTDLCWPKPEPTSGSEQFKADHQHQRLEVGKKRVQQM